MLGYNMFAYCNNNPVVRVDEGGTFWETVIDVFSLGASVVDVVQNPDDPWAWVGLAADTIDLLPFVTGVGEITRAVNTGLKIADKVDDAVDVVKIIDRTEDIIDITTDGIKYTDKVIKQMNNANKAIRYINEYIKKNGEAFYVIIVTK